MILLTLEEAVALLLEAQDVNYRIAEKGVHNRKQEGTVPLGTLTCGELVRMNRGLRMLIWQLFPELESEEGVDAVIRNAVVASAGGAMN